MSSVVLCLTPQEEVTYQCDKKCKMLHDISKIHRNWSTEAIGTTSNRGSIFPRRNWVKKGNQASYFDTHVSDFIPTHSLRWRRQSSLRALNTARCAFQNNLPDPFYSDGVVSRNIKRASIPCIHSYFIYSHAFAQQNLNVTERISWRIGSASCTKQLFQNIFVWHAKLVFRILTTAEAAWSSSFFVL